MKVLIADKFDSEGLEHIETLGCDVTSAPDLTADDLPGAIDDHEVLIVRSTRVCREVIDRGTKLSLVIRAGAGYDTIDVASASERGVFVANCPGKNSVAVAELAWGLIIACDRRIPQQTIELREKRWNKKEYSKATGLYGKTLGVVGVGRIGEEVIERAHAFGMPVIAWSRSLDDERAADLGVRRVPRPEDVAHGADVISVHVASTPQTRHLVGRQFCEALRPGAIVVNTTRGAVVDEQALLDAMDSKGVRAGLDVYENEPGAADPAFDSPLARHPSTVGSHHIGASTAQAQSAIAGEAVRILESYMLTGDVPNCVNRCEKSAATRLLTVRHLNRPGVLAHVIGAIGRAEINIEEMENIIYEGAQAACARIRLDAEPDPATLTDIADASHHILSVDMTLID